MDRVHQLVVGRFVVAEQSDNFVISGIKGRLPERETGLVIRRVLDATVDRRRVPSFVLLVVPLVLIKKSFELFHSRRFEFVYFGPPLFMGTIRDFSSARVGFFSVSSRTCV